MAREIGSQFPEEKHIVLSRADATHLISLLTGLLAGEPVSGHGAGAVPRIKVSIDERGRAYYLNMSVKGRDE